MNAPPVRTALHAPLVPDLREALLDALGAPSVDAPGVAIVTPTPGLGRDLIEAHARRHGWTAGVQSLGLRDLALALTARERVQERRGVLGVEARAWLVRRLQRARDRAPTSFDPVLEVRGFRAALLHAFEALGRAGLASSAELEHCILRHGFDLPLQARQVLELALAWRRSFEAAHDDAASLLVRASEAPVGRAREILPARLWWCGFDTLGVLERRLVAALAADPALEMRMFLPADAAADDSLDPFLTGLGFEIARPPVRSTSLPPDVRAIACPSVESEAEEIARALLVAAGDGMRFDRMAVLVPHALRLDRLRETLARRGIPCVFHPGRALRAARSGRAFLFFLDVVEAPLALETTLDFLSVAPLRGGWGTADADHTPSRWERAAREAGVGIGLADWQSKLERYADAQATAAAARDSDSDPSIRARTAAQAARELLAVATALDRERAAFPERGRWSERVAAADAFLERVFEPSADVDAMRAAVGRLAALDALGAPGVSRAEFRDTVRTLLAETHEEPEPMASAVRAGTAAALEGFEFDLVCLAGVQEGEWPAAPPHDPVLRARERAALGPLLPAGGRLAEPEDEIEKSRRRFARACRAARRRLVVAWARLDPVTGAVCLPSSLVLDLAARREGRAIDYEGILALPWVERVPLHRAALPEPLPELGFDELDVAHALGLPAALARRYVNGLGDCARRGMGIDRARHQTARFTNADGMLSTPAALHALAARFASPSFSATQLGRYAACPFRAYLHDVLRLEMLDRDDRRDVSGLEVGRIAHRILEAFYATLGRDAARIADQSDAEIAARLHAAAEPICLEAEAAGRTGARLLWSIRKQRLLEDLRRFLRRERRRDAGRYEPVAFESRFGRGTSERVTLRISDRESVGLHGVLDRLDRDAAGALRVVDYKTGKVVARERDPAAVQLAVYLWAVTGGDPERLQASEARSVSVTRRGGFAALRLDGERLDARRGDFQSFVRGVVDGMRGGRFPPTPGKGGQRCLACDYEPLCEAAVSDQSERKSAAGQLAVHDALPDPVDWLEEEGG